MNIEKNAMAWLFNPNRVKSTSTGCFGTSITDATLKWCISVKGMLPTKAGCRIYPHPKWGHCGQNCHFHSFHPVFGWHYHQYPIATGPTCHLRPDCRPPRPWPCWQKPWGCGTRQNTVTGTLQVEARTNVVGIQGQMQACIQKSGTARQQTNPLIAEMKVGSYRLIKASQAACSR